MEKFSEIEIRKAISNVFDNDLGMSLDELNAIEFVKITDDKIIITLRLTQPIYQIAQNINEQCIKELRKLSSTAIFEILIKENIVDISKRTVLPNVKNIIAVASGKGGVGKSSVAANLALALSKLGAKVGILDGDVYGPSQPTMFGLANAKLEAMQSEDGSVKARPTKKFGIDVASMGFIMTQDQAAIVRGPMLAGYFSMLFEQIGWGYLDFLIFDLPPGTGDIQLTLVQKIPLTGTVIVTTPQEISLADVRRSISMFEKVKVDILGVVENMSYFTPPDALDKKYYIFGQGGGEKISKEFDVEFFGEIPLDMNMREYNDSGMPIVERDFEHPQSQIIVEIAKKVMIKTRKVNYQNENNSELEISI